MIRRAAFVVVALTLNTALVRAQDTVFTVDVASAEIHKGPSTVNPVIAHVPQGTELPVSRTLGSWVKVAWPAAEDGTAYVHVTMGHVGPPKPVVDWPPTRNSAYGSPVHANGTPRMRRR